MAGLTKAQRAEKAARLAAEQAKPETEEVDVALPPLSPPPAVETSEEEEEAPQVEVPIESKTSGELKKMLVGGALEVEVKRRVDLEVARRRTTLGDNRIKRKQDRELAGLLEGKDLGPHDKLLIEAEIAERKAGRSSAPPESATL